MNPLIPLLDMFDKVIRERGSADILRERLQLAADQYSFLERKYKDSEAENISLKADNQKLKSEKARLENENTELKETIRKLNKDDSDFSFGTVIS